MTMSNLEYSMDSDFAMQNWTKPKHNLEVPRSEKQPKEIKDN